MSRLKNIYCAVVYVFSFSTFVLKAIDIPQETQADFRIVQVSSGFLDSFSSIYSFVNNECIGFLSYTKIPLCNYYVFHSFYVYPEHRNKGYGSSLLEYGCKHLHELGAKKIYIQPGPYELQDGYHKEIASDLRQEKIEQLCNFYKKFGFKFVSTFILFLAWIAYYFIGIDEDFSYLMSKDII